MEETPEEGRIPFKSRARIAVSFNREEGRVLAHVKGAAEAVVPLCAGVDQQAIDAALDELSQQGYRVLAVVAGEVDAELAEAEAASQGLQGLSFLGLVGLIDPLRPQVPEAVERCHSAGVSVRMVTGDHPATGLSIARELGIAGEDDEAVTGADLILTDDNFASIVNGIEQGRITYANVRKVTWLLISTGAAEIVLLFLAFAVNLPLPLRAVQLFWLNLVTNGLQDVALAFEKGEPDVLERQPRPTQQPIFDRRMIEQTITSGVYMGLVAFGVFYWLHELTGWSEFDVRNALLLFMVLFENVHILNCRSAFAAPLQANLLLIATVLAAQGVHILALYLPALSDALGTAPMSLGLWLALLGVASSLLLVMELFKCLRRPTLRRAETAAAGA